MKNTPELNIYIEVKWALGADFLTAKWNGPGNHNPESFFSAETNMNAEKKGAFDTALNNTAKLLAATHLKKTIHYFGDKKENGFLVEFPSGNGTTWFYYPVWPEDITVGGKQLAEVFKNLSDEEKANFTAEIC